MMCMSMQAVFFFGMQRTLARYDRSVDKWNSTEDADVPPVPAETASLLARLCRAADSESLRSALVDLDLSLAPCHLDGAEASKFWRRQPLEGEHTASHTQGLYHFVTSSQCMVRVNICRLPFCT